MDLGSLLYIGAGGKQNNKENRVNYAGQNHPKK
jgi:hypothetical protein